MPVHARRAGGGHPFVEVTEPRPAEVRPDEVAETRGRALASSSHVLDAVVGDLRSADPAAQLRVGLEHLALEIHAPSTLNSADPPSLVVTLTWPCAVLLVERSGERMSQTEHVSHPPTRPS